jgi:hypothetical protein
LKVFSRGESTNRAGLAVNQTGACLGAAFRQELLIAASFPDIPVKGYSIKIFKNNG